MINTKVLVGIVVAAVCAVFLFGNQVPQLGGASQGSRANIASSTSRALTAGAVAGLFGTTTSCTSRIITTQAGYLQLTFTDRAGQSPAGSFGILQAASTTVVYDAEIYGCDLVKGISNVAQTVTLTDVR